MPGSPTESLAQAEADDLRLNINPFTPDQAIKDISVGALANHYREHELPDIFYKDEPTKSRTNHESRVHAGYLRWLFKEVDFCLAGGHTVCLRSKP